MVNELMVASVIRTPAESRTFKSCSTKKEDVDFYRPASLKREVGKQTVVTERDAHRRRYEEKQEHRCKKEIKTVVPEINGNSKHGGKESAEKKEGVNPVNFVPKKFLHNKESRKLISLESRLQVAQSDGG